MIKYPRNFKKDVKNFLGISVDLRNKVYKELFNRLGGSEETINHLSNRLKEVPEYNKKIIKNAKQLPKTRNNIEKNKTYRYIGSIVVEYRITEDRELENGGGSEIYKMKKVYENKNRSIYRITDNIRFDKLTNKKNLEKDVKEMVEEKRKNILESDGYIIKVETMNIQSNIHKYTNGTNYENIKMKSSSTYKYDGYDNQQWDTNTGKCVFDYIIYTYKDIKGFKTICNYEELNKLFRCFEDKDCLDQGVDTTQIMLFCVRFKLPMYALDDDEKAFKTYHPENRNKKAPMMMFRISNNHFHPIPAIKQKSILQTTSILNTTSDLITTIKNKEETNKKVINNTIILEDTNAVIELGKIINETKIIPTNIKMTNKKLNSFIVDNTQYAINQHIELTKQITNNMGLDYEGQSLGTLIGKIIEDTIKLLPKSNHNPNVYKQLLIAKKSRAFGGLINEEYVNLLDNSNTIARDITKCYTSVMYKPIEEWIRLDFNDCWTLYNGNDIVLGLYYVETEDITLFKKSDIYSSAIIKKAIEENIEFKITHQLISKNKEEKDLFVKVIDKIVEYSKGDKQLYKLMINMMSGLLGKNKTSVSNCNINNNIEQIFYGINEYEKLDKRTFINKIPETEYYLYGTDDEIILSETNLPMYIQVLDQSNIKVYDMMKQMNGILIGRKVDCVVIYYPNGNLPEEEEGKEWGSVRSCSIPFIDYVEEFNEKEYNFSKNWNDRNINDSDNWEKIMEVMVEKGGLLLQSDAGNGKTYVAKNISKNLSNVKKLAPTNKAALNINGSTIHRFLKMDEEGSISKKVLDSIKKKYKYMIIDEISMISKDIWKRLVLLKQATGIIFLLIGDNKQLPPVEDEEIEDYFNHPAVHYLTNNNRNILTIRKRFDERLYNYLKNVDSLDISLFDVKETPRNLCYYNRTRKHINKIWNEKLKKDNCLFLKEDIEDEYTQDMNIYQELPVIARKTVDKGEICMNNETFEVLNYDNDNIYLWNTRPNDDGEPEIHSIDIKIENFIEIFSLNYCSTTHKSQGETINENFTIYDWEKMSSKCRYTALSRARKPEQVSFYYNKTMYKKPIVKEEFIIIEETIIIEEPIIVKEPIIIKEIENYHIVEEETFKYNKYVEKYYDDTSTEWINEEKVFEKVIDKKIKSHIKYDSKKEFQSNITTNKVKTLFNKQNGCCNICNCEMKRFNYKSNDRKQFSIDRINPFYGHTDDNIQLLCWGCNNEKSNRF